jgi:hypothetical protein
MTLVGGKHWSERGKIWHALVVPDTSAVGHSKIDSIVRCLGIEVDDAVEIAEKIDLLRCSALPPIPDVVGKVICVADCRSANDSFWDGAVLCGAPSVWMCSSPSGMQRRSRPQTHTTRMTAIGPQRRFDS